MIAAAISPTLKLDAWATDSAVGAAVVFASIKGYGSTLLSLRGAMALITLVCSIYVHTTHVRPATLDRHVPRGVGPLVAALVACSGGELGASTVRERPAPAARGQPGVVGATASRLLHAVTVCVLHVRQLLRPSRRQRLAGAGKPRRGVRLRMLNRRAVEAAERASESVRTVGGLRPACRDHHWWRGPLSPPPRVLVRAS